METIMENKNLKPDNKSNEIHQHSYILRIWKSAEGVLKGYILDPMTNKTYPLVNIPIHWDGETDSQVPIPDCENPLVEPFGCHLGVWKPQIE